MLPVLTEDRTIRKAGLFGIHGMQVCVTDGRRVYMKAQKRAEDVQLYNYTLMPTHMVGFFSPEELRSMQVAGPLPFSKEYPVMRFKARHYPSNRDLPTSHDLLYLLENDPNQDSPLVDVRTEDVMQMTEMLMDLLQESDAPAELYDRLGLEN